jgi:DNA-binding GntR family transcriptional regulator
MANKVKLKEKAYTIIKQKINDFELKPKQIIFETEISKSLNMSRTPVREALDRLEQEGLISRLTTGRGYSVVDISTEGIEELFAIREALEIMALKAAIKKAKKEDWIRLEKKLLNRAAPQRKVSKKHYETLPEDAQKFHREIVRLSGMTTLAQLNDIVTDKVDRFRWMNVFFEDRAKQSRDEHLDLIKYLKEGRTEDAMAATRKHIRASRDNILTLLHKKTNLLYID